MAEEGIRTVADGRGWHDPETGLFGPRAWDTIVGTESARCSRYHRTATIVVVELVGFGELESVWGADVAPREVRAIGSVVRSGARLSDYVARLGPRRFAILLPETDEIAAVNFVERVRQRCTEAVRQAAAGARCAFGWADATKERTLQEAAELAIARLSLDAEPD